MTTIISSSTKPRAPALPVDILKNDTARLYTHVHPALVLSLYALRFNAIVADPVPALTTTLIPLSLLQIAYVAICLPPTGGTASAPLTNDKRKVGDKKKAEKGRLERAIGSKVIVSPPLYVAGAIGISIKTGSAACILTHSQPGFLSLMIASLVATPLLSGLLVLFGAPLTTHHAHTLLASAHISFLVIIPLVYVHGVEGVTWREIIALLRPVDEVYGAMVGTFVGAWLGAIPIPLDWDREWQKWPVTIVTGAYGGYVVGKLLGGTLLKGKKIMFEEKAS